MTLVRGIIDKHLSLVRSWTQKFLTERCSRGGNPQRLPETTSLAVTEGLRKNRVRIRRNWQQLLVQTPSRKQPLHQRLDGTRPGSLIQGHNYGHRTIAAGQTLVQNGALVSVTWQGL
jgi:hypothetical protein